MVDARCADCDDVVPSTAVIVIFAVIRQTISDRFYRSRHGDGAKFAATLRVINIGVTGMHPKVEERHPKVSISKIFFVVHSSEDGENMRKY